jgi:hypothetical protein
VDKLGREYTKVQFGDYQANGVMAVAKKLGMAPRQLAEQVLSHLDLNGIASKVEIAGPGFINIDRGIANDGRTQMADVHLFRHVRRRVVDDDGLYLRRGAATTCRAGTVSS